MIFIAAISKFYQEKFGIRTFYYFYLIPIVLFFAVIINLYSYNTPISEIVGFIGVLISLISTFYLYRIMVGVK